MPPDATPRAALAPVVLTFHGIGPIPRRIDDGERHCWLDQETFEAVLDVVASAHAVELTFDDGNASDLEIALPALKRRGLSATFFVCSGRLDQPTFLSATAVRTLQSEGMRIGSHGVDHVPWRRLASAQLEKEVSQSRRALEQVTGSPVETAACPFGAYDRRSLQALRRAGYRRIYTSDGGVARPHAWVSGRTTVTQTTTIHQLAKLVEQRPSWTRQAFIDFKQTVKRLR
jgi:peptidoglycan/xylan/chitin deacetylase (PgdA/CDA1 family)